MTSESKALVPAPMQQVQSTPIQRDGRQVTRRLVEANGTRFWIVDCEQLSPEWWEARCGIPTASEFKRIITAKDAKPSTAMGGYAAELAADLICQSPTYFNNQNRPTNKHMDRGHCLEQKALDQYAFDADVEIERVGFCQSEDLRWGCSPDGLIKVNGEYVAGIEVKCPEPKKHAKHLLKGVLPLEYKAQCHGGPAVLGLPYWVFVEYAEGMNAFTVKITPDDFTAKLKEQMEAFWVLYQAVKIQLGVTKVEGQTNQQVSGCIQRWKEKLATAPDLPVLNDWLAENKENVGTKHEIPQDARLPVWEMIKAYGLSRGWEFDWDTKIWKDRAEQI